MGDDASREASGVAAGAPSQDVHEFQRVASAGLSELLVDVGSVCAAASSHRHSEQRAGRRVTDDGVVVLAVTPLDSRCS
jgi:hypothetical protein